MAGTRTAPDVAIAAPNSVTTTIHLMDASGDIFTDAITSTSSPTVAQIEAWVAAYQAATNASVYKVSQVNTWEGDADPNNAVADYRASVANGINLLYKNLTTLKSTTPRVVAPVAGAMQGNQDIPILGVAPMSTLITAELALLAGYELQSAQYTERRERKNNARIKV